MKVKRITIAAFIFALSVSAVSVNAEAKNSEMDTYSVCRLTGTRDVFYRDFVESVVDHLIEMSGIPLNQIGDFNFEINTVYDCFVFLGLDSLNAVEFIMWLEDEYAIEMPVTAFSEFLYSPLGSFCQYVFTLIP